MLTARALAVALLLAAAAPTAALADSDPASDVLPTADVFLPYQPKFSAAQQADLNGVTAAAKKAGYPIKVATIASPIDLGGVPDLFNQPDRYAGYLGQEISFNNKQQPLLVVMPAGLGTFQAGTRAAAAVRGTKVETTADGLTSTTVKAVQKMAAAEGHPIRGFKPSSVSGSGGGAPAWIFAVPVALLVLLFAFLTYRRASDDEALVGVNPEGQGDEAGDGEPDSEDGAGAAGRTNDPSAQVVPPQKDEQ
jgi:hypothetical protein